MKTVATGEDPFAFLDRVENTRRASDARVVVALMQRVTGHAPRMWGDSIIGFGSYSYKRRNGSEHDFMLTGVSPRKAALTIYILPGFDRFASDLSRLGKSRHSSSCLYIPRLEVIDMSVLEDMIAESVRIMRERYPA